MKYKTKDIVIGVLSVAVVVLLIFMIAGNSNVTGNAFFDFFKAKEVRETGMEKQTTTTQTSSNFAQGLLAQTYLDNGGDKNMLQNYEVRYDENGNLIYEFSKSGLALGQNYEVSSNSEIVNKESGLEVGMTVSAPLNIALRGKVQGCVGDSIPGNTCIPSCVGSQVCNQWVSSSGVTYSCCEQNNAQ